MPGQAGRNCSEVQFHPFSSSRESFVADCWAEKRAVYFCIISWTNSLSVHNHDQYGFRRCLEFKQGENIQSILPSPSWSASRIISSTSSSVNFSPMEVMT